jgi:hypothetical protein
MILHVNSLVQATPVSICNCPDKEGGESQSIRNAQNKQKNV